MNRTLSLRREALAELSPETLARVAGAAGTHVLCETGITYCGICDPHRA